MDGLCGVDTLQDIALFPNGLQGKAAVDEARLVPLLRSSGMEGYSSTRHGGQTMITMSCLPLYLSDAMDLAREYKNESFG